MLETPRTRGPQFVARNLRCTIKSSEGGNVERLLYSNINFEVGPGEILFIRGPSGTGKTLLLRSLAVLDPIQSPGIVTFDGKTPENWGVTHWRSLICYVFQQRVAYPGSPSELYFKAQQFKSQKGRARLDLPTIIHSLGLEQSVLLQPWASLSGGQAQRVQLAIALALQPSVLLVDEPTSALDPDSSRRVEKLLKNCGAAVIWVSHDRTQPGRVGGRVLDLVTGQQSIASTPPPSPGLAEVSSLP